MFQHEVRFRRKILFHHHHRALRSHAQRRRIERGRLPLQRHVNVGANAQQHTLAALALLAYYRCFCG